MIMRESGIVETNRVGSNIYYKVVNPKIVEACDLVRRMFSDKAEKQNQVLFGKSHHQINLHFSIPQFLGIYGGSPLQKTKFVVFLFGRLFLAYFVRVFRRVQVFALWIG